MSLSYQERKAKGQRKRAEYLRRVDNADHLAVMFRSIALGVGFMFVMGIVSNADRLIEVVLLIVYAQVIFFSLFFSQHVMFIAEQTCYPKSRRRTLRSEVADEWREFRNKKS